MYIKNTTNSYIPWVAWLLVDIQLKILIVDQEAATLFENGKMCVVALTQHVQIITVIQLGFDFN